MNTLGRPAARREKAVNGCEETSGHWDVQNVSEKNEQRDGYKGRKAPMSELVIVGSGVAARMAHHYFTRDSEHEVVAFTVDQQYLKDDSFLGLPLVNLESVVQRYPPDRYQMFVAMGYAGMNKPRAAKYYQAKEMGYHLVSYVSTRCTLLTDHALGDNCFILEDNTIQPFARIGNDVTLWSGNHIGHDSVIEDHCFLASHIVVSGFAHIGPFCFLGVNATLRDGINIAPETLVGAGAIIMNDTVAQGVYLPQRAKLFHKKSSEIDFK
jgi:sugar O-acyltransferase (sialic acid O-acetyltransferase NeuD family)